MKTKRYAFKSKNGHVASVTVNGGRRPNKKVQEALSTLVDLAYDELEKQPPKAKPMERCAALLDATGKTKVGFGSEIMIGHMRFVRYAHKINGNWYYNIDNGVDRHNTSSLSDEVLEKIILYMQ